MTRHTALLLIALMALTPVMGALCAEGCTEPEPPSAAQVASGCDHGVVPAGSPVLTAAACSDERAEVVLAEVRTIDSALTASIGGTQITDAADRLPVPTGYLQHQPTPAGSQAVLRI